jgi:hypothetical protein
MALGDITATTTAYTTMELLNTALDALNTGAATAGADTTTFIITPGRNAFFLTTIVRAAA